MGADTVDDVIHHEEHEEQEGERQKNEIQSGIPPSSPFFVFFMSFMVDYGRLRGGCWPYPRPSA